MFDATEARNTTLGARDLIKKYKVKWVVWNLEKGIKSACRHGSIGVEREFYFSFQTWWADEVQDHFQNLGYHIKIVASPYKPKSENVTLVTVTWF